MPPLRIRSFSKINLHLHVLGRRPDGYHDLRTIFQAISLHDTLELAFQPQPGIALETDDPALPVGRENLVWKALDGLRRELRLKRGIRARLQKRIPVARGLGGGSSNAAAAMLGLLRLARRKLPRERLFEIASSLGADVPFFLVGGRALGIGRGDQIIPLPDGPKRAVVVVSPAGIEVSTRAAYGWLDSRLTKRAPAHKLWSFCALCWSPHEAGCSNDFEAPVFARHPRLARLKRVLLRQGAAEAALAGSGSAVFGVFQSLARARRAAQGFPKDRVFVVQTLTRGEYCRAIGGGWLV